MRQKEKLELDGKDAQGQQDRQDQFAKIFTNDAGITARVCPQGHVYLQVGHTSISFKKEHFVDLAQVVHAAERHIVESGTHWASQTRH